MEVLVINRTIAVLSNKTMNRAQVIARRTGSEMMGVVKAQMIETLKAKMAAGVAHFLFKKKDGSLRECWGTCVPNLMRATQNGLGLSGDEVNTIKFWDIEKGSYRSCRFENLIQVF